MSAENNLEIVINARDYASDALRGVTGAVRGLGQSTVALAGSFAMLTHEAGVQIPALNSVLKALEVVGVTFRAVSSAMQMYEAMTRAVAAAEWAHNAALAFKAALIPLVGAAVVAGALAAAAAVHAPSMQFGGVVEREGVYHLHPGELVVPGAVSGVGFGSSSAATFNQYIHVSLENRAPIASELDKEALLRELGREVAERVRRAGYR